MKVDGRDGAVGDGRNGDMPELIIAGSGFEQVRKRILHPRVKDRRKWGFHHQGAKDTKGMRGGRVLESAPNKLALASFDRPSFVAFAPFVVSYPGIWADPC